MLAAERLHVSLRHVGDHPGLPDAVVDKASTIAATVRRPSFTVAFNSVMSLHGRRGNQPFILRRDDGVVGFTMLQQALDEAMEKAGVPRAVLRYAPHLTVMYGDRFVTEQPLDVEVKWVTA